MKKNALDVQIMARGNFVKPHMIVETTKTVRIDIENFRNLDIVHEKIRTGMPGKSLLMNRILSSSAFYEFKPFLFQNICFTDKYFQCLIKINNHESSYTEKVLAIKIDDLDVD
jgi:hypothetical protein